MHSNRARSTGNVVARIASTWMVVERLGGRHAARSHTDATCCTAACLSGYSISNALNHYNGGGREKEGEGERETRGWRSKVLRYSRCRHEEADFAAVAVPSFEEFARRLRRYLHKLPEGMAGGSGVRFSMRRRR